MAVSAEFVSSQVYRKKIRLNIGRNSVAECETSDALRTLHLTGGVLIVSV